MRHKRLIGTLLLVAALALIAHFSGLRDNFSLATLRDTFMAHKFTGVLLFVVLFSVGNLLHVPGLLFQAAAVLSLGKWWGGLVTYLAANVACLVTFSVFRAVGGSALMLQVPMLDPSNDVDIVLEERTGRAPSAERVADVMHTLGFVKEPGRHWSLGGCFVEFPGGGIDEPVDRMGAPGSMLHVLSVEAMLVQRLSSYRSTGATAHGAQAAFIIRAIGARLDMARLAPLATREGVVAYYNAVRTLALGTPTTALDEQTFRDLYWAMKTPRVTAAEAVSRVSAARVRAETPAPPALTEPSTVPNTPSP